MFSPRSYNIYSSWFEPQFCKLRLIDTFLLAVLVTVTANSNGQVLQAYVNILKVKTGDCIRLLGVRASVCLNDSSISRYWWFQACTDKRTDAYITLSYLTLRDFFNYKFLSHINICYTFPYQTVKLPYNLRTVHFINRVPVYCRTRRYPCTLLVSTPPPSTTTRPAASPFCHFQQKPLTGSTYTLQ